MPVPIQALRQLPLTHIDIVLVFADVNENDVHAHGGSELQIADSEAITSTVLLRELHAQAHAAALTAGGRGLPPLNIVATFSACVTVDPCSKNAFRLRLFILLLRFFFLMIELVVKAIAH